MIPAWLPEWPAGAAVANHLWQSTLCVGAAALLVRLLKHQAARWRYRVWLAASLKFLVPFALLATIGTSLQPPRFVAGPAPVAGANVTAPVVVVTSDLPQASESWPLIQFGLVAIWAAGVVVLLAARVVRWRRLKALLDAAPAVAVGTEAHAFERALSDVSVHASVQLRASTAPVEPGVVGIVRPAILWPAALLGRLSDRELEAIFAHELAHVRRRDNLTAAVHGWLEIFFWFHPVIWWLKSRLVAERERACDEAALRVGVEPQSYVRGILKVCEFCLQSPVTPAAAVTGADLLRRVEDIMTARPVPTLSVARRTLLAVAALAVVIGPVVVGSLHASSIPMPSVGQPALRFVRTAARVPEAPVAQSQTGRVSGAVTDQRGAAIAEATVKAAPYGGGTGVTIVTDAEGRYTLDLPPAQYEVSIQKMGFTASTGTVFVNRGTQVRHDAQLRVGGVTESIRVTNAAAAADLQAAPETIDRAKASLEQGRYAEAENLLTRAVQAIRASRMAAAAANRDAALAQAQAAGGPIRVGGEIAPPKKIVDAPPVYPQTAREARIGGIVIIEAVIGTDGAVKEARILRGQPLLNQAALDAVTQWVYTPTLLNGAPVEVQMAVTVNFTLQ